MSGSRRSDHPQHHQQQQQSLSLELEEQQQQGRPSFVTYMEQANRATTISSRDHHDQQLYQFNTRLAYDSSSPSARQPPQQHHPQQQQQQQHVLEGAFFWGAAARSSGTGGGPPHFSVPVPYNLRESLARQEEEATALAIPTLVIRPPPQPVLAGSSRSADEPNTLEMNVRGMNVISLAAPHVQQHQQQPQRSWPHADQQQQQHQHHHHHHHQLAQLQFHQLQQLQLQQQHHAAQQQQQQQNIHHHQQRPDSPATVVHQVGHRSAGSSAILQQIQQHDQQQQEQLHQQQFQQQVHHPQQHNLLGSSSSTASAGGGSTCKECGNQAKKDCTYQRCRTCCKSRGYECATHVRSTWVPAAKRRERQIAEAAAVASGQPRPKSKRNRAIAMQQQQLQLQHQQSSGEQQLMILDEDITAVTPTTTNTSNSPHSDARQSQDVGNLPSEVRAQAVFKCVKVTSVDDGGDEFAYQAVVRIGGRIFKGVLQDHGLDTGGSLSGDQDTTSLGDLQQHGSGAAEGAAGSSTPAQLLPLDPMFPPVSSGQSHYHQSSSREVGD